MMRQALLDQAGAICCLKYQRRVEARLQHQAQGRAQIGIVISQQEAFHACHLLTVYAQMTELSLPCSGVLTWSNG